MNKFKPSFCLKKFSMLFLILEFFNEEIGLEF